MFELLGFGRFGPAKPQELRPPIVPTALAPLARHPLPAALLAPSSLLLPPPILLPAQPAQPAVQKESKEAASAKC
ncbi:hypothetical protein B0H14DRAFT_3435605 [Mycena olivaceomarginata]|nr:hypothetical protein B0H14DRAFT_3435605 [Mycena olivaceomarginata]